MNPHTPITNLVWHIMGSIPHLPTFMLILLPSARQNTSFSHMRQKFKAESFTAAATWLPSGVSPKFLQESLLRLSHPLVSETWEIKWWCHRDQGTSWVLSFQANRKDLQRFLGLNDSEEMVYIRNVRRPVRHEHRGPGGSSRLSRGENI